MSEKKLERGELDYSSLIGEYVVVRSNMAGCFFGKLVQMANSSLAKGEDAPTLYHVQLEDSRRIWYWDGANSLSDLAVNGVKKPEECKFPVAIKRHFVHDVNEVISTTPEAKASIDGVPIWTYGSN